MAFDELLAERVTIATRRKGFESKKLFGGIGFLLNGNMCVGVWRDLLIVRVGLEKYAEAIDCEGVREFDITGKPMRGWVFVEPAVIRTDEELTTWVNKGISFVKSLPKK